MNETISKGDIYIFQNCCGKITLFGNNIPSSLHRALIVLLKASKMVQNHGHRGFPRPGVDTLRMEDWENPARNMSTLTAAHPEQ